MRVAFLTVAIILMLPPAAAQGATVGPSGIHLAWGSDPKTMVSISWTSSPDPSARVESGETTGYGTNVAATPRPLPGRPTLAYTATLTGLKAGTTYHYRVVSSGASRDFNFTTAPEGPAEFRVTAWGDQGVQTAALGESDGDNPNRVTALGARLAPAFHLHPGDLSYSNGVPETWDAYFAMLEPFAASVPYMPALGNHEREAGQGFAQYDARFALPSTGAGRWYSFRYADALFISLDTEHACTQTAAFDQSSGVVSARCDLGPNAEQQSFLDNVAKAARAQGVTWIVAYHHYPLWSNARHGSNSTAQTLWGPIYDRHAVDLVIQAHDHVYQRFKPIRGGSLAVDGGTTFVTVGTGGASHYTFPAGKANDPPSAWTGAKVGDKYGALQLTFANGTLRGEFIQLDGTVFDRFLLAKGADGRSYQANESVGPSPTPTEAPASRTPGFAFLTAAFAVTVAARGRRR